MKMATELVNSATSDKLTETDWIKNIEICELVARDNRYQVSTCSECVSLFI